MLDSIFRLLARCVLAARRLHTLYKQFMHRHVENIGLLGSLGMVLAISYGLFLLDPRTPSLSVAMLQVIALAPVLLFVALHCATYTYKHLLPDQFKQFMTELGSKLTQPVLPELEQILPTPSYFQSPQEALATAQFKLKYSLAKYAIRCTRFALFGLPFYLLFKQSVDLLKFVLSLQPH